VRWLIAILGAAALTVALSPSARSASLRAIFDNPRGPRLGRRLQEYADRPLPAPYSGPKYVTYHSGRPTYEESI
jgi:hypothetical protein